MTFTLSLDVPARFVLAAELMLIFLGIMSTDGAGLDLGSVGTGLTRGGIGGGVASARDPPEYAYSK